MLGVWIRRTLPRDLCAAGPWKPGLEVKNDFPGATFCSIAKKNIGEQHNPAEQSPEVVKGLRGKANAFLCQLGQFPHRNAKSRYKTVHTQESGNSHRPGGVLNTFQ